jgi:hypothetical protein
MSRKIIFEDTIETSFSRIRCSVIKYEGERKPICGILKFTGDWECETIYTGNDRKEFDRIYADLKENEVFDID